MNASLVFRNIAAAQKQWLQIDDGDHYNLSAVGGEPYKNRILEFFNTYLAL